MRSWESVRRATALAGGRSPTLAYGMLGVSRRGVSIGLAARVPGGLRRPAGARTTPHSAPGGSYFPASRTLHPARQQRHAAPATVPVPAPDTRITPHPVWTVPLPDRAAHPVSVRPRRPAPGSRCPQPATHRRPHQGRRASASASSVSPRNPARLTASVAWITSGQAMRAARLRPRARRPAPPRRPRR
jgi:hypothetical protein